MSSHNLAKLDLKELACLIYKTLEEHGITAVLVGGACVSIYSENRYQSYDLDFATYENLKEIENALSKLGFTKTGRCFSHPQCRFLVDFVNPPIAIGHEAIHHFETLKTQLGSLRLLTPTDCVKDRLASFFHWEDAQALDQAALVAQGHKIDRKNLERWAKKEGHLDKLRIFFDQLGLKKSSLKK